MNGTKVPGLLAVGALLVLTAPVERASALSLINPGAAAPIQKDSRQLTTEVHWHHHHWLMGKFCNGELAAVWSAAKPKTRAFAPHYGLALRKAMSLSGGPKETLRRCGGTIATMASSFSVGSPRV